MSEAATFSDRVRGAVIAVAVLSLVATIGVMVFGRRLAEPPAQTRDSYGRGPLGHRAWVETLQGLGVHVVRWTRVDYHDVTAPLFLVEPNDAEVQTEQGAASVSEIVQSRIEQGRVTVLVLPKWVVGQFGIASPELRRNIEALLAGTPLDEAQLVWPEHVSSERQTITATGPALGERTLELPWPQTIVGAEPVLSGPTGALIASDPTHRFFVISDPDLVHNFDVQRAGHAALARDFVRDVLAADTIVVDEVFHERVETRSLAELFGRFPGVLALAHGALAILVVLLYGRKRFGPPRGEPPPYGRGPREVIDVAAGVLASGQSPEQLAPRYVEQVILDAHRRLGLTEGRTLAQKAAALDAVLTRRGLLPDAARLLATSTSASRDTALAIAARAAAMRASLLGRAGTAADTKQSAPEVPARPRSSVPPPPIDPNDNPSQNASSP
jgi:hypothetical protein